MSAIADFDFVDYTNVTEMEKIEFKLISSMKEIKSEVANCTAEEDESTRLSRPLKFRDVDFKINLIKSKENPILQGIPHFRYDEKLPRMFNLKEFWLIECSDQNRVLSESTGRLLLGTLIQACRGEADRENEAVFVRIGALGEINEKFIGFRKCSKVKERKSEYFETFLNVKTDEKFDYKSAQIILEWFPGDLRINFPGFSGYFDSWHPIERIEVACFWPQIPREGLKFQREEFETCPIFLAKFEESDLNTPLRNSSLRSNQSSHLREILFTDFGATKLVNIPITNSTSNNNNINNNNNNNNKNTNNNTSIKFVYEEMAQVYLRETEKLEKDVTIRYNFIPKRIMEAMRFERINEAFSWIWRKFIKSIDEAWLNLKRIDLLESEGDIETSLKLINWCIERELEWEEQLSNHVLLGKLYKIPPRHQFTNKSIDVKIEEMEGKLSEGLEEMNELKRELTADSEDLNEACETEDRKAYGKIAGHLIYEPVILNCEPPPTKLMTEALLKTPLAGEVVALNQLKEDMRVFKAWNREICKIKCVINRTDGKIGINNEAVVDDQVNVDFGFIGFLLWHSPNDLEISEKDGEEEEYFVSQRMRDNEGQWLNLWRFEENETRLNNQISFNHRAILGQVMNDLMLKTDIKTLLESATPFLTRRAAELLGPEAEEILKKIIGEFGDETDEGGYPLDVINDKLDEHERELTKTLALEALCGDIFTSHRPNEQILVLKEDQRQFLVNDQHEFKVKRKELVRLDTDGTGDSEFREIIDGVEGIKVKLSY